MIRIVVLGSGAAVPSPKRNLCSIAMRYSGDVYLFDCGEGSQRQMMKYKISYAKVKLILISHLHDDHILGIPGLFYTLKMVGFEGSLKIFGPVGTKDRIMKLVGRKEINAEINDIDENWIYGGKGFKIKAFKTEHTASSLGYVFEEDTVRRFDKERCKELGIKGGMFRKLEEFGEIDLKGRKIKIEEITYEKKGKKIVYTGDTSYCEETVKNSKDADVLFHEATFIESEREEAEKDKHSTILDAAKVAKEANVERLVAFHISTRYKNSKEMEKEGRGYFENLTVANDGMEILL